jgi:prophage regulatory protein
LIAGVMQMKLLRKPSVLQKTGRSKSSLYNDIGQGLFPPPIKINHSSSAWPDFEVDTIIAAIIRGESSDTIKNIVNELVEARKTFSGDVHKFNVDRNDSSK